MSSQTGPRQFRFEVCSSCLRAAGLVSNREDRERVFGEIENKVRDGWVQSQTEEKFEEKFEVQLGQCQRLCQDGHITVARSEMTNDPQSGPVAGPATLSMSADPSIDSVVSEILSCTSPRR